MALAMKAILLMTMAAALVTIYAARDRYSVEYYDTFPSGSAESLSGVTFVDGKFVVPPQPYPDDALEPVISKVRICFA